MRTAPKARTRKITPTGRCWSLGLVSALWLLGVAMPAAAAPIQLRLSYTGDTATTMTVAWNTAESDTAEVRYGTSPGTYTLTQTGSSRESNAGLGYVHEVTLTGLSPSTTYYYVAGSAAGGYSQEHELTTGPLADESCGSFSFVFVGDNRPDPIFGGGETWPQILNQLWAHGPAFVLNGGDLVPEGDRVDQWVTFLNDTSPVAAELPIMPCIGNHDDGPGEGEGANYNEIFALPRSTGTYGSDTEDYYYFTYGNAIFVSLSTTTFKGGTTKYDNQAQWLDEVLTQNPRKWKFVFYHEMSYSHEAIFEISHAPNEDGQNAAFIPIIDKHHVDVVFTSHNHWYERFHPTACANAGTPNSSEACSVGTDNFAQGTVFYVSGGAGAFTIPGFLCGSEPGRAKCSGLHHYILVSIADEQLAIRTYSAHPAPNQVMDQIAIVKSVSPCTPTGVDGGVPDAGPADAAPGMDASSPPADSGSVGTDAGGPPQSDAGAGVGPGSASGCGCRVAEGGASGLVLLLILGLVLVARRRRGSIRPS